MQGVYVNVPAGDWSLFRELIRKFGWQAETREQLLDRFVGSRPANSANTSASVLMINAQGIMLSVCGHDYFLSYNRIPWMQDAPIRSVLNVKMSGPEAIEWPDLDVDLEIDSLRHPEKYPLLIKRNQLDFVGI